jgi:thiol-disulfide isomerase/thioredoxin
MHISSFLFLSVLFTHTDTAVSEIKAIKTDSVTVSIKLAGNKKVTVAITDTFQRGQFITFANTAPRPSFVTKRIPLPHNRLVHYRAYHKTVFYNDFLFTKANDSLIFEVDSNYALKQIRPELRNTFLKNIFNIWDDFSIKKRFDQYTDEDFKKHYEAADSAFVANNQKNENLYKDHLINDSDFASFRSYIKINYYFRILHPVSYNFPYSSKLDPYITPYIKQIEDYVRRDTALFSEKKEIVKFLMKYYLFHLNKNTPEFALYRDILLDKNFGDVVLPLLLEKLQTYPTKKDSVFSETFRKLNERTSDRYKGYVDSIKKSYSIAKLKVENVHFLSNGNSEELSLTQLLKKYRGNIVVLDFWASWCIPCIQEFPALAKLETQYTGMPVKFIGISLDDDNKVSSWTNMAKKQKLRTTDQYKLIDPRRSDLTSFYKIQSLPRYIVLDKNGNLINDHFVLPSSMEFEKELNKLLTDQQ